MGERQFRLDVENFKEQSFLGNKYLTFSASRYEIPFEIEPTKGDHSLDSCEDCQKEHAKIQKFLGERLELFPECCEFHKGLLNYKAFKKEDFKGVDKQIADKLFFAYHHAINNIESDNWYYEITDYLEYVRDSFGSMPKNCGEPLEYNRYLFWLKELLSRFEDEYEGELDETVAKSRLNKIIKYIEPIEKETIADKHNFNVLLKTYEDWYKIFPFDLSIFEHLRQKFKNIIPLYKDKPRLNKYLGTYSGTPHTKESLGSSLINITSQILTSVNCLKLYEEGKLTDSEKISLELILKNRRLELLELSEQKNATKQDFIKIIKKWLKGEKEFVKDIKPYLTNSDQSKPSINSKAGNSKRPDRSDVAFFIYYTSQTKELQLNSEFPSEDAWKEIAKDYGKHWKNIQLRYNEIYSNRELRLTPNRNKNLEYVVKNMLEDFPKALKLASDELKVLKTRS